MRSWRARLAPSGALLRHGVHAAHIRTSDSDLGTTCAPAPAMKLLRVWACWIIAPIAVTLLHEVGHLLLAAAFGAPAERLMVGPFGGGYARYDATRLGSIGAMVALAGGLLVNVATGIPLLIASRRFPRGGMPAIALSTLGTLSLVFAAFYVFIGFHVGIGDAARILQLSGGERFLRTGPCLLRPLTEASCAMGVLAATYVCAREFERHQSMLWPSEQARVRVLRAAIGAIPLVLAFMLRVLVYDPSGIAQGALKSGPRVTMKILERLETSEPTLDGPGRFARASEILRSMGPVDNRPEPALGVYLLLAAMGAVGVFAVAVRGTPERVLKADTTRLPSTDDFQIALHPEDSPTRWPRHSSDRKEPSP